MRMKNLGMVMMTTVGIGLSDAIGDVEPGKDRAGDSSEEAYLPPFMWEVGEGLSLRRSYIYGDIMSAEFTDGQLGAGDERVSSINLEIHVFNTSEEAESNFISTDTLPGPLAGRRNESSIDFEIGEQCSYIYGGGYPSVTVVHFRRATYNVHAIFRGKEIDDQAALKREREGFRAKLEKLDSALQEWELTDFVRMLEEHAPEWVKQEEEPISNPSEEVTKEEAFRLLADPATDELSRIGAFGPLRLREYDEDAEEFGRLMIQLAENDPSPVVQAEAIKLLKVIKWPGSVEYLRKFVEAGPKFAVKDDSFEALNHQSRRHHALNALVRIHGANELRALLEGLHHDENEYPRVREGAGMFLNNIEK